jgi:putative ribosome biogenesis GTPase RsgA
MDLSFDARIIDTPGIKGFGSRYEPEKLVGIFLNFQIERSVQI